MMSNSSNLDSRVFMRVINSIVVMLSVALTACGGGSGGGTPGAGSSSLVPSVSSASSISSSITNSSAPTIALEQRINAVNTTVANNSICKSIEIFYWEIGDKTGALASGWGG